MTKLLFTYQSWSNIKKHKKIGGWFFSCKGEIVNSLIQSNLCKVSCKSYELFWSFFWICHVVNYLKINFNLFFSISVSLTHAFIQFMQNTLEVCIMPKLQASLFFLLSFLNNYWTESFSITINMTITGKLMRKIQTKLRVNISFFLKLSRFLENFHARKWESQMKRWMQEGRLSVMMSQSLW